MTAEHPDVIKAVNAAIEKASSAPLDYTPEMYMEALKEGVDRAEEKQRENDPLGPKSVLCVCTYVKHYMHCRFGGWVIDGFPETRENWAAMIDNNLLPDFVLSIEDEQAPKDFLLTRFTEMKGLPTPTTVSYHLTCTCVMIVIKFI